MKIKQNKVIKKQLKNSVYTGDFSKIYDLMEFCKNPAVRTGGQGVAGSNPVNPTRFYM